MKIQNQSDMLTLSFCGYGIKSTISGRYLAEGFDVLITSDYFDDSDKSVVIGSTNEAYSWRKFASILCTIEEGFIGPDCYSRVEVTGIDRIRADILVLSWSYPETDQEFVEWLLAQSDETLDYLQQHVGSLLDGQNSDVIREISSLFLEVHGAGNLLNVFSKDSSLSSIISSLELKSNDLKLLEETRKAKVLQPYESKILKVIDTYGDDHQRFMRPTTTNLLRTWIKEYILSNGTFPEGKHSVVIAEKYDLGTIDFSLAE